MSTSLQSEQGVCGLCGCTKTPSWRKNVLPGALICNACCCFLYRRIRSGRGGVGRGASLGRAVSSLAQKLLAGRSGLPRSEASRASKQPGRAAAVKPPADAQPGRGDEPHAKEPGEPRGVGAQHEAAAAHELLPSNGLEAFNARPLTGHQAQQLLTEQLLRLDEAAAQRERADLQEAAAALQRQRDCEQAWLEKMQRRARQQARLHDPRGQVHMEKKPHARGDMCPAAGSAAPADSRPCLEVLREAAWRSAVDQQAAAEAMMAAWRSGYALPGLKLPGVSPSPLGAAPAVWLLQAQQGEGGHCPLPLPVGLLLLRVHPADPPTAGGHEQPCLRLLVHSRRDGMLLQAWDSAAGAVQGALERHPRFGLPCWDSGEGWQLLFPEPQIERHQAELFTVALASFSPAAHPWEPALPLTPPKHGDSPAACSPDGRLQDQAAPQPPAKRQLLSLASPLQPAQRGTTHGVALAGPAAPAPASRPPQPHPCRPSAAPASPPLEQLSCDSLGSVALSPRIPETADLVAWHSGVCCAELPAHSTTGLPVRHARPTAAAAAPPDSPHAAHDLAVLAALGGVEGACASSWGAQAGGSSAGSAAASPAAGCPSKGVSRAAGLHPGGSGAHALQLMADLTSLPLMDFEWEDDLSDDLPEDAFCDIDALCAWGT